MSTLEQAKLDEASRVFRSAFINSELDTSSRELMPLLTEEVPVSGSELKPKFASRQWGVREWADKRTFSKLKNFDFSVPMKTWENGLQVSVDDLMDDADALATYKPEIEGMRDDFEEHRLELVLDLLAAGFDASLFTAYDGQFFFDSDHQDFQGGPVQSNVATAVLAEASFKTARAAMWGIRKPNGMLARVRATHLIVPVALQSTAEAIFLARTLASGADNTLFNAVKVIVEPRLDASSTTAWFLADASKRIKPFMMGNRRAVKFTAKTADSDDNIFHENTALFGADGRYNAIGAWWQLMYGSDGTV